MSSPYRADQVGSFLRPAELLQARLSPTPLSELRALEDQHILRVLEKQKELGFEVFTDGELRRSNFMSDFTDAVEGFDLDDAVARKWADTAQNTGTQAATVSRVNGIVTSRLKQREPITGHELPFLREIFLKDVRIRI